MSVTILLVGLVVFAFFAAHLLNRYAARYVPLSGVEYLLVGALIGPQIPPRVLSNASLEQLRPLVSLLLGLMGFLVGLQARGRPNRHTLTGTVIALATVLALAASFAAAYGALVSPSDLALLDRTLFAIEGYRFELFLTREQCAIALVLAAIAGVTFSSSALRLRAEVPAFQLLRQAALAGQWVAVVTVALVLAWSRSQSPTSSLADSAAYWFAGATLLMSLSLDVRDLGGDAGERADADGFADAGARAVSLLGRQALMIWKIGAPRCGRAWSARSRRWPDERCPRWCEAAACSWPSGRRYCRPRFRPGPRPS